MLWTRPTVALKRICEFGDKISRREAFNIFTRGFDLINFVDDFFFIGSCIIVLVLCPLLVYKFHSET